MKLDDYECPRCGYKTEFKTCIKRHFYVKKKQCATIKSMVVLTDEIKEHILEYRKYIFGSTEKKPDGVMLNMINNYNTNNTINNIVSGIEVIKKLTKYTDYKNIETIDFDDSVENKFAHKARRLEKNQYKQVLSINNDDLLQIIDQVSKVSDANTFEDLNIIYDPKLDKLKIFDGEWKEFLLLKGVKTIVETIQTYYLDAYECYLIRRNRDDTVSLSSRNQCLELLEVYYKFISVFDIEPYIKGKSDNKILYSSDDERYDIDYESHDIENHSIVDKLYPLYCKTRDKIKKTEANSIIKSVVDIIKRNSSVNIEELNMKITELFNMDREFATILWNN